MATLAKEVSQPDAGAIQKGDVAISQVIHQGVRQAAWVEHDLA